ncbi:MAG: hypothetical protein ACYC39_06645 [Thiobacillus sp.]
MIIHIITMKKPISLFLAACCGAIAMQTTGSALAKDDSTIVGIHIQRKGDSPHFKKLAKQSLNVIKGTCISQKQTCQHLIADPAASPKAKARCAAVLAAGEFQFTGGSLEDVGQRTTDEYFVPGRSWSARIARETVLNQSGFCKAEVAEVTRHEIRHYTAGGYTRYELQDSAKKRRHWTRTEHRVDPKLVPVLAAAFLAPGRISVSPPMGHKTYIPGITCEVRQVSLGDAATSTSCLYHTGLSFPAALRIAGDFVSGGEVMWGEKAVAYKDRAVFPIGQFMPPARDKVISEGESQRSSENATQKWCAKQKKKTGVDPCAEESGDD